MINKKTLILGLLFPALLVQGQIDKSKYTCDPESFRLLKSLSESQLKNGDVLLFTTTHQDLAWLNSIDACIADRDTLWLTPFLKRLEKEPDFRMDVEQTSILMEYIHRHPESKELIGKYIREGRICVGATYIQPYEEMYAGESLARQFYLGKRWLKKTFGEYNPLSYFNVDVPGRTLQMPQIMQKAGVDNLVISRHERGLFYWMAPDGSKVRTYSPGHYIYFYNVLGKADTAAIRDFAQESVLWYTKYNDVKRASTVMPAMLNYELSWDQKPVANCSVFAKKWNNLRWIENEETGKKVKVTLPKFKYATADEFFNSLDKSTSSLPVRAGERPNVWLYIHGPSHEKAITYSREGDRLLPAAEKLSSFVAMTTGSFTNYPQLALQDAWKSKIYPDHGWGGNKGESTDNTFLRKYEHAWNVAKRIVDEQKNILASMVNTQVEKGTPIILMNTLSFSRTTPVHVEVSFVPGYAKQVEIKDHTGLVLASQLENVSYYPDQTIERAKVCFVPKNIPAFGLSTFYLNPTVKQRISSFTANNLIENSFYRIELTNGGIKQIWDKATNVPLLNTEKFLGGEVISLHSKGNGAGEFDAVQQPDMEDFDKISLHAKEWVLVSDGEVYSAYKLRTPIRHAMVELVLRVYHQTKKIDMDVSLLNWEEVMFREFRQMWPLAQKKSEVSYEVPYGVVTVGKDEMPGAAGERYYVENKKQHPRGIGNWISASDDKTTVVMSSSVAVADYIDPTDQPVDYTILQPILLASRKSCHHLGNDYTQPGDHHYHFSISSFASTDENKRESFGLSANEPLQYVYNPFPYSNRPLFERTSFVTADNPKIIVTALKSVKMIIPTLLDYTIRLPIIKWCNLIS